MRTLLCHTNIWIDAQEFNGAYHEPPIEIRYMGEPLVRDVDFQVVYSNNDMVADRISC